MNIAYATDHTCVNRRVIVELEKNQVSLLKSFFEVQSDLPYAFKEKTGKKGLGILEISYRRKMGKENFPEPLSPSLFSKVVERLSDRFESLKIKKISAEFVPGQCP